jgi:hypothetical protein
MTNTDVAAIKALASGLARQDQQKTALDYIVSVLAMTYDLSYRPDELGGERDTSFAEGRRYVGLAIRRMIMLPVDELVPSPSKEETDG